MKKKILEIPNWWMLIPIGVAFIMILLGSFFDLDISKNIANVDNGFANFMETYGMVFGYALIPIGASMTFLGLWKNEKKWLKALGVILLILAILVGGYTFATFFKIEDPADPTLEERTYGLQISSNIWICCAIAIPIFILISVLTILVVDKSDPILLIKVGIILFSSVILQWVILKLFKNIGGRPRYRFLSDVGGVYGSEATKYGFMNWWEFAWFSNPSMDYFASWPSGHTACTTMLMGLAYASNCFKFKKNWLKPVLFSCGLVITLVMALARIMAGAHFLSDTGFGLLFGTLILWALALVIEKIFKKKEPEKQTE